MAEKQATQPPMQRSSASGRALLTRSSSRFNQWIPTEQLKQSQEKHAKLWKLMQSYLSTDVEDIEQYVANHIEYTLARTRFTFDLKSAYQATAHSLRDRMIETWNDTQSYYYDQDVKRVYYLSIEYLHGRTLRNAVHNLDLVGEYAEAMEDLGVTMEELYEQEQDAGLGNGGLGRLASCFLDSMATLNIPSWGYGIRYKYGIFKQEIQNGEQVEAPDYWLLQGSPWEFERNDVQYNIGFGGSVTQVFEEGRTKAIWHPARVCIAQAYDVCIPGFRTLNVNTMRLWRSLPSSEFDFQQFNKGDYYSNLREQKRMSNISTVLYPNDATPRGKELRFNQQYFFVSASIRDIMRRFKKHNKPLTEFQTRVAIQLNDTHPTIGVVELLRVLLDEEKTYLSWDEAWKIITETFGYTNHTVLPEALEKWSVPLLQSVVPRHLELIYEINHRFLIQVREKFKGQPDLEQRVSRMSLIQESNPKKVRMAHLGIVGSHSVNGVAAIHSGIIKESIFKDFYELWPEKFNNKTNGVTPRRWLHQCNKSLSNVITKALGNDDWVKDLDKLSGIASFAEDMDLQDSFVRVKHNNKVILAEVIREQTDIKVNPDALFDVQIKRIHEYKRQLLNILSVVAQYLEILEEPDKAKSEMVPRVVIFGGKAAPGYHKAKMIIKLICSVAKVINNDYSISNLLKVVFLPNYNVSLAEVIIPAADISQHISTAGYEASGTSNMKFALNAGIILGTWDGANIEIAEEVGVENVYIFGTRKDGVATARRRGHRQIDVRLYNVLKAIESGNDYYLVAEDFASYLECKKKVDKNFQDKDLWARQMILTTAGMGKFSSDRTIKEYAREIWNVKPCALPLVEDPQYNVPKMGKTPTSFTPDSNSSHE